MFMGLMTALLYLALEPFVRRRWPTALISWSRVLTGRLRDARVGRDVLLGGTAALACDVVTRIGEALLGEAAAIEGVRRVSMGFMSPWSALSQVVHVSGDAFMITMALTLTFALLRSLLRLTWLASGVGVVAIFLLQSGMQISSPADLIGLGQPVLFVWLLTRYGLLAAAVLMWAGLIVNNLGPRATAPWEVHATVVAVLTLVVVALWAWRQALADRPVFERTDVPGRRGR